MCPAKLANGLLTPFGLPQNPDNLFFRKPLLLHFESPRLQEILTFPLLQFSGSRSRELSLFIN
ncbi:MAG: hypothetical protein P8168_02975, partial [Deltaproteobacteria bacterium]